jgi:CheY-like chemotaxis protein
VRGASLSEPVAHRILVVEDNQDVGDLVSIALSSLVEGARTVRAENGLAALRHLQADEPWDLVLCDIMMPGLDGARLLRDLHARDGLKGLRVLVLTAVPAEQIDDILQIPEVVGYLQKPVDPIQLADRVKQLLA